MKNRFEELNDADLLLCYEQFKRLRESGETQAQPLKGIVEAYVTDSNMGVGLMSCSQHLLETIAERWYNMCVTGALYRVTYYDKDGRGFSEAEPWVLDDYVDKKKAEIAAEQLRSDGYKKVEIETHRWRGKGNT